MPGFWHFSLFLGRKYHPFPILNLRMSLIAVVVCKKSDEKTPFVELNFPFFQEAHFVFSDPCDVKLGHVISFSCLWEVHVW